MIIFICLIFLTFSCVSASDDGINIVADGSNIENNDSNLDNDDNLDDGEFDLTDIESNQYANFTALNDLINEADSIVNLSEDYQAINNTDNISISKSVTIYGNNHTLDCRNASIIIDVNDSQIVFDSICFKDPNFQALDLHDVDISFIDCSFEFYVDDENITVIEPPYKKTTTGSIDKKIKNLALSIIGKSEDLAACKKLAVWVGKNIGHESREGFYQSPLTTLNRKKGNCCTQTNLFLQMCQAVGLTKTHKFYFIHVGQYYFGARHFFAMVDNLLVDVDGQPDDPWGQASIGNRGIYRVTQYPVLPVARNY